MTRRDLFALAAAALLACSDPPAPLPLAPRPHLEAARLVGRTWLDEGGEPHDLKALSARLLDGFVGTDPAAFTVHLQAHHQADLASGRTARVGGWLLSQTEAWLYGWLALA